METWDAVTGRRSVRQFKDEPVSDEQLDHLVEAAHWAPSGLNNQPWRFMKVTDRSLIERLSSMTRYRGTVAGSAAVIAVFLDHDESYDRTKDVQSCGAAIQNMLLAAFDMGLGTCWLGEILKRHEDVEALLSVRTGLELMAVVVVGHPVEKELAGVRHPVETFLIPPPERG